MGHEETALDQSGRVMTVANIPHVFASDACSMLSDHVGGRWIPIVLVGGLEGRTASQSTVRYLDSTVF